MGTGLRLRRVVVGALALVCVAFVSLPSARAHAFDPIGEGRACKADPTNMGWQHRGVSYWKDNDSDDAAGPLYRS